jgi:hypothetical protein
MRLVVPLIFGLVKCHTKELKKNPAEEISGFIVFVFLCPKIFTKEAATL